MLPFLQSSTNYTPSGNEFSDYDALIRFTPALFIGDPSGFNCEVYNSSGHKRSLKHLKFSANAVSSGFEPMFRLDTLDLYSGFQSSNISGIEDSIEEHFNDPNKIIASPSCPVSFQRVHFYGYSNGIRDEYYSVFLVGNPVKVSGNASGYDGGEPEVKQWVPGYCYSIDPTDSGKFRDRVIMGGGAGETSYAFQTSAIPNTGGTFDVTVIGGAAQVIGGNEIVFPDTSFSGVENDELIFIKYKMWDSDGLGLYQWETGILHAMDIYEGIEEDDRSKSMIFTLSKIGSGYNGNVAQFRLGAINAVATINASPETSAITSLPLA